MANGEQRPIIYLVGTSGTPNYGDELITAGWLRYYAETLPETDVWVETPRPGQSAILHGGIHPRARFVDTLFHGCWIAPSEEVPDLIAFGDRVAGEPGLLPREATGVEEFSRVALVHVMGGAYINALWPRHVMLLSAAASIARTNRVPAVLTGAALTPLPPSGNDAVAKLITEFDVVDVRDKASEQWLSPLIPHLTNTGDDALLFAGDGRFDQRSPHKILIAVQNDMLTEPLERIADYIVRTVKAWGAEQARITLVESMPPDDIAVASLLGEQLPNIDVLPFSYLWRNHFPAAPRARWITTRYHAHLMGALAGGWGVVLPVGGDTTTSSPADIIEQGSGWTLAPDLGEPIPANRSAGVAFGGKASQLRAAKQGIATKIVAKAREARSANR